MGANQEHKPTENLPVAKLKPKYKINILNTFFPCD